MAFKVLLATTVGWLSAGRLAGAFSAAGCSVAAILPAGHPAAQSRYFGQRHAYRPLDAARGFTRAISAADPDLIVPLDDRAVSLLLDVHRNGQASVKPVIEHSLGNIGSYKSLSSRAGLMESAKLAGIRIPQTRAVTTIADIASATAAFGFPLVIKADGTWGGDGVVVAKTESEAAAAFAELATAPSRLRSIARAIKRADAHYLLAAMLAKPQTISVQQFIRGTPATTTMACWQGKVLAANHFEILAAREETGPASVLRPFHNSDMDEAAARLAARFELSGLHGLDYIKDTDGNVHLIEINPRAPQTAYLSFGEGHDPAVALVIAAGALATAARRAIAGDTVALFRGNGCAIRRALISGPLITTCLGMIRRLCGRGFRRIRPGQPCKNGSNSSPRTRQRQSCPRLGRKPANPKLPQSNF